MLLGLRGVISCSARSSSSVLTVESIQPKQIASSTASGYGHTGRPEADRHEHSQTPRAVAWLVASQARHCARCSAWKIGRSNFHVGGWSDADGLSSAIVDRSYEAPSPRSPEDGRAR